MPDANLDNVRIGLLGSGFVANFYMEGLANVNHQTVVSNWSRSLETAGSFAEKWGIPEPTDDIDSFIGRDDIDLYMVGVPNHVHLEYGLKLIEAGRAQVMTKPLARNAKEAKQLLDAAESAGVFNGYAETEVFAPAVVQAEQMIRDGALGRLTWVRSREAHSGPHSPHFWDPELTGGGALNDMGCHCIEAARYFFGKDDKVVKVMAYGDLLVHKDKTKAEDNAILVMIFESGGIGHCELSWTTQGGLDLRNEVFGTEGTIFTDVCRATPLLAFTKGGAGYLVEKADAETGWVRPVPEEAFTYGYQGEMKHFVDCLRLGKKPREDFLDGYIVNIILDAGYESMKSGKWVKVSY
ncbi:Gfo/Idh/MocA family protein [candidate division KSB1 bacterium]